MPDDITEFGMKMIMPDLMTIECLAKSDGYPKFIQLVFLFFLHESQNSIRTKKEYEDGRQDESDQNSQNSAGYKDGEPPAEWVYLSLN